MNSSDSLNVTYSFCARYPDQFPCQTSVVVAVSVAIAGGACALLFGHLLAAPCHDATIGNELLNCIGGKVQTGLRAFVVAEYKNVLAFVGIFFALLWAVHTFDPAVGVQESLRMSHVAAFLLCASLSFAAGWYGITMAMKGYGQRSKTVNDSFGIAAALRVAFAGGAIMGVVSVGFGLVCSPYIIHFLTLAQNNGEPLLETSSDHA